MSQTRPCMWKIIVESIVIHRVTSLIILSVALIVLTSCTTPQPQPTTDPVLTDTPLADMPNPASVYCEGQGYKIEIRTAADGSQSGACIFPDGSECDEWAYFRGECAPASQGGSTPTSPMDPASQVSTEIPTPLPIVPADYQGWWTYTHAVYGFSIMLPGEWVVDETTSDPLMTGHLIILHPEKEVENLSLRVTFRNIGEEALLWPTGVGQGEFVHHGTLDVAGQPVVRILLVCPTGQVNSIWYHQSDSQANIQRGNLEFGFIYSFTGIYCQEGYSLSGEVQRVGEMIIASLNVP